MKKENESLSLDMIKRLQFSFMRCFILLFIGLYGATSIAQPEQYDMTTDSDSEVRVFNLNAVPSEIVKGKFMGKELEFKKFDGIHQLLSVPSSLRKKAEVAPFGGRVRCSG